MASRSFYDQGMQADDMQLQVYSLLARYIEEAGMSIEENDPYGLFKTIQKIYPCIHTRLPKEKREKIKKDIDEIHGNLFGDQHNDEELTEYMDLLYDLYLDLQEVLQKEGISIRVRFDPGSIVARQ